uniref:Fibroblast growth factor 5 n=3 Tax=Felis catus TaxID=9685 RepID=A0ABI7ZZE6_FELCA
IPRRWLRWEGGGAARENCWGAWPRSARAQRRGTAPLRPASPPTHSLPSPPSSTPPAPGTAKLPPRTGQRVHKAAGEGKLRRRAPSSEITGVINIPVPAPRSIRVASLSLPPSLPRGYVHPVRRGGQRQRHAAARGLRSPEPTLQDALRTPAAGRMSLSFLLLLFLSHLILSAWAHGEKHLAPKGQPGPAATGRNPAGASSSRSSRGTTSSSSSSVSSSHSASLGNQGSGLEQSSFQWSPSGRRTGSLYCRVGIGFHLQIYPDGKVNGSHEANMLSQISR